MRYFTIEKNIGETPLEALERGRLLYAIEKDIPLAYAGRLDPMASGTLIILVGEECKKQKRYHGLDKEYIFEMVCGLKTDTGDVLGLVSPCQSDIYAQTELDALARSMTGDIELPYPLFSSKTVRGKPLHMWTLENRLAEIKIPTAQTKILRFTCTDVREATREEIAIHALRKIEHIPKVIDPRKELGRDFRRTEVRELWKKVAATEPKKLHTIATFKITVTSGTYIRSLIPEIAKRIGTCGLAYSIHRTKIGRYLPLSKRFGFWLKTL